jgi:hypothetical protein
MTNITAHPIRLDAVLVIMSVSIFKTYVILYLQKKLYIFNYLAVALKCVNYVVFFIAYMKASTRDAKILYKFTHFNATAR